MKNRSITFSTIVLTFLLFVVSGSLLAQDRWSLELRPGVDFATDDLGDADLGTGFGIEGTVAYSILPDLGIYAGWSWNRFSADESFAGADMDFEETGYTFGLQFMRPIGESSLRYLIRAGGIYNHIEVENEDGDIIADSGHGIGWQAGVGVGIGLGERLMLTPTVRYRALSRDIEIEGTETLKMPVDLNYLSVGVGLAVKF